MILTKVPEDVETAESHEVEEVIVCPAARR